MTFFSVGLIDSVTERRQAELSDRARVNVRFFSAIAILLLGQIGSSMSSGLFMGIVAIICLAQVIFDMMMAPLEDNKVESLKVAEVARRREAGEAVASGRRDISEAVRTGTPADLRRDFYFFFMQGSWTRLIFVLTFLYVVLNIVFAALYLLEPGSIKPDQTFTDAFFFSVQTMAPIGYGVLSPATEYANMLVTAEAAFGIFGTALATGLMFAKASRPQASVLFSDVMVVNTRNGKPTLTFRAGNARGNEVVDASISVSALVDEISAEGDHIRRVLDLKLQRDRTPIFALSWSVMHVIDEDSPLFGIDFANPSSPLLAIIVTMIGHDSTYGQQTFARHMYTPDQIREKERFVDVMSQLEDGRLLIDFSKFHLTEPE
ncbi:MAG: ion channel [bacterium]